MQAFSLDWLSQVQQRLPHVIVITESVANVYNQIALSSADASASGSAMTSNTLIKPIIPIALEAVARTPATGELAPAYASGAAKWNGAALDLEAETNQYQTKGDDFQDAGACPICFDY